MAIYAVLMAILIFFGGDAINELRATDYCSVGAHCWWDTADTLPIALVFVVPFGIVLCFLSWFDFIQRGWRKSGWMAFVVFAVVLTEISLLSFSDRALEIVEQILR